MEDDFEKFQIAFKKNEVKEIQFWIENIVKTFSSMFNTYFYFSNLFQFEMQKKSFFGKKKYTQMFKHICENLYLF